MTHTLKTHMQLWRADKLIGFWLALWPSLWALQLARPTATPFSPQDLLYILLFTTGCFFMRSAGCIINDIFDREVDKRVNRTKTRPLARGALTLSAAKGSLIMALIGAYGSWFCLPIQVKILSLYVLPLVFFYPLMKRWTHWPQLFLGITFNWGVLMGWSIYEPLNTAAITLYAGALFWTLAYDTIYALQDKEDDLKIGVKSSAIILRGAVKPFAIICTALFGICLCICSWLQSVSLLPIVLCIAALGYNLWHLSRLDIRTPDACRQYFIQQGWFGGDILFLLLINRFH
ncbi:4-hydroxybenzoate octaprenyltransferase [Alphaproteobacteria bacterium]|nr:4-hydroxybenzoate octaprenyltransferase [Alphaproteobacteria bacterium]